MFVLEYDWVINKFYVKIAGKEWYLSYVGMIIVGRARQYWKA